MSKGFVYLIWAEGTNIYKVGRTEGPVSTRLQALQTSSPMALSLVGYIESADHSVTESLIHEWLGEFRQGKSEWFSLTPIGISHVVALFARKGSLVQMASPTGEVKTKTKTQRAMEIGGSEAECRALFFKNMEGYPSTLPVSKSQVWRWLGYRSDQRLTRNQRYKIFCDVFELWKLTRNFKNTLPPESGAEQAASTQATEQQ